MTTACSRSSMILSDAGQNSRCTSASSQTSEIRKILDTAAEPRVLHHRCHRTACVRRQFYSCGEEIASMLTRSRDQASDGTGYWIGRTRPSDFKNATSVFCQILSDGNIRQIGLLQRVPEVPARKPDHEPPVVAVFFASNDSSQFTCPRLSRLIIFRNARTIDRPPLSPPE